MSPELRLTALGLASLTLSCSAPAARVWEHPSRAEWQRAEGALARLRAAAPTRPYTATVATSLREPRTGQLFEGRGAIAIAPGGAVRMILVGVAGATLIDAWVTAHQYRVAVPPLGSVRRGATDDPRDLPVGFFRWWLLGRLDGALFAAHARDGADEWLLRRDGAVIQLRRTSDFQLTAVRHAHGRAERVDERRSGPAPSAGDRVVYVDETTGLEVRLTVESIAAAAPDPAAFRDPDAAEGGS